MAIKLFGFSFGSNEDEQEDKSSLKAITREPNDGSLVVTQNHENDVIGDTWGWSVSFDADPTVLSESALITKYREMSLVPEVEKAIDIIVNEMISTAHDTLVSLDLDKVEYSESLKKKIINEFDYILRLLDFNGSGYEILRRWYIDGRMQYQVVIDEKNYSQVGIGKLTYIDPRKLKKIRVVRKDKDARTGVETYEEKKSYYLYSEHGVLNTNTNPGEVANHASTVSIAEESIVQVTSGLLDPSNSTVLSYLHKAIRPLNQLKSLEDATMIYKLSRAPERRIFYIDVGNLPPAKAEQVLQKQMNQYRSKMIYDVNTGSVRSDSKQMTMIEDYWLPRRSDGRATEITTLPGGTQLGQMEELQYFLNKLYNALNVPITRMDPSTGFSFGRTTEITRDEVSLTKFIARLRRRFSNMFLDLLKRQLALKNILNDDEFENIRQDIAFIFESDNHFDEMLETEVRETRLNQLDRVAQYLPNHQDPSRIFFSKDYVWREILKLTDEEIEQMKEEIEDELKLLPKVDPDGNPLPVSEPPKTTQIVHSSAPKPPQQNKTINTSNQNTQQPQGNNNVITSYD